MAGDVPAGGEGLTFARSAAQLLAHMRLDGLSPATVKICSDGLNRFGEWLARERINDLRAVTHVHLTAYQAYVRKEPLKRASQVHRIRAVKKLFGFLAEQGALLLDPSEGIEAGKRGKALPRPILSDSETKRLLEAPNVARLCGIRDRALLEVLYGTAMRIGELERAQDRDVDLHQQTVTLRHTKNGRPRVVPLGRQATRWLKEYLERVRPRLASRASERALFLVRGGRLLRQVIVRQLLTHYGLKAAIRKAVSPHVLRHTCATHLLRAGANERAIQELLGHVKLSSTVVYTRVAALEVKATHERFHPGNRRAA